MKQSDLMMESEGNAWFDRNRDALDSKIDNDIVTCMIASLKLDPKMVIEVGSSSGWRLRALKDIYGCQVYGIEPSAHALRMGRINGVPGSRLTADHLPYGFTGKADVLIYGFCLYLVDPADWFKVAAEGDRVLASGGHLIIHDFYAGIHCPFAVPYEHREGMMSYHYDFSKLWLGNPLYTHVRRHLDDEADEMVTVLKKLPLASIKVEE